MKDRIQILTNERDSLIDAQLRKSMLKSRRDWLEYGEKNTKYFFNLEKARYKKKNRYSLVDSKGKLCTNPKDILSIQDEFYSNLYRSRELKVDSNYIQSANLSKLSDEEGQGMGRPITKQEIKQVIWQLKKNKAPGNDGLTVEFYKYFWDEIHGILFRMYDEVMEKGFEISQRRGIISLLEKR